MERKELLRNMMIMATSDGQLTQRELELLSDRCEHWGISEEEFMQIIEESLAEKSDLSFPKSRREREELLKEMIHMMAADGRLAESEKQLFAIVAVAMKFSNDEIQSLIDRTLDEPLNPHHG